MCYESTHIPRFSALAVAAILYGCSALSSASEPEPTPESPEIHVKRNIVIPMRDGIDLMADAYLPSDEGSYAIILMRTPYARKASVNWLGDYIRDHVSAQFGVVVQDIRGTGESEGELDNFEHDGNDGYDTIEWISRQSWSNGKTGMTGPSALGMVQWMAARERPPHLTCIFPQTAHGHFRDDQHPLFGGAFTMSWALSWTPADPDSDTGLGDTDLNRDDVYSYRPIRDMARAAGFDIPLYERYMKSMYSDQFWDNEDQITDEDFRKMKTPAYTTTGWFDADQPSALIYWRKMRDLSKATGDQYLIIGPWDHHEVGSDSTSDYIGVLSRRGSSVDKTALSIAWFKHCLNGESDRFQEVPRVQVFMTGANEWRAYDRYPPEGTRNRSLFLHSNGHANSLAGDGMLRWSPPADEQPADAYVYDPLKPVPAHIGSDGLGITGHAEDERAIERRDDVLVYTSEALSAPIEVLGPVSVTLYAASDARDTDWTAKLLDVYPDGAAVRLGINPAGIVRARYRKGSDQELLLVPNRSEKYTIKLYDFGHVFMPGHRIRVEISSSAYPFFNPNQNTGHPIVDDVEWNTAKQKVFHDPDRPSHITLPIAPRTPLQE